MKGANNLVAKHNPHKGGVHGRTDKAKRRKEKESLVKEAHSSAKDLINRTKDS